MVTGQIDTCINCALSGVNCTWKLVLGHLIGVHFSSGALNFEATQSMR